jgi:hypothetical protein
VRVGARLTAGRRCHLVRVRVRVRVGGKGRVGVRVSVRVRVTAGHLRHRRWRK